MRNLTFLKEEEILGDNNLDIMKIIGSKAESTDLVLLTGSLEDFYWTKSYNKGNIFVINASGNKQDIKESYARVGIRPVFKYSLFSPLRLNNVVEKDGYIEGEYGEYPQNIISEKYAKRIERVYQEGNLKTTGKSYNLPIEELQTISAGLDESNKEYQEYEYNGAKYIRIKARGDISPGKKSSNGESISPQEPYWVKVEPITWIVDKKNHLAISKNILTSGVRFTLLDFSKKGNSYDGNFENTNIKNFMDKYMQSDMFEISKLSNYQYEESISDKVNDMVDEIYEVLENYYGSEDIKSEIDKLVNKYNKDIKTSNPDEIKIDSESKDKKHLYNTLMMELENILSRIKEHMTENKEYYKMLDLIIDCKTVLENPDRINPKDDLVSDVKNIKEITLSFLEDNKKEEKISNIFTSEEKKIIDYLKGKNNDISKYQNLEEYKLSLREKLHPFIQELYGDVKSSNLVEEIKQGYLDICNGVFNKSKEDQINSFLDQINEEIEDIKMYGNDKEVEKLNKIISKEMKFDDNLSTGLKNIKQLFMDVYQISLEVKERLENEKEIEEYTVELDNDRT